MFQLCEITNQDSLYYNITVEEGETLLKSFFFLGVNMNSHYLYQIAKRNLKDLLEFITQQQNKLDNIDTLECNRLLYNYVDTFYSFVNYYESHYKEEFAGIKRKFYDTYFEYRFIYNLRNYMVHESLGILKVTKEIYPDTILVKFIVETNYAKSKIGAARLFYENKLKGKAENRDIFVNTYPKRVILLSDKLHTPAVSDLWDYHRHFYKQIGEENKTRFSFEDLAGIYKSGGRENLFALCITYEDTEGIKVLPAGRYLCAGCTEENCGETEARLMRIAASDYMQSPEFIIRIVVLTGILKWNYQMQVYIGS